MSASSEDEHWMRCALAEAEAAASDGEVPVGAILVEAGEPIGVGRNRCVERGTALAHAEMLALADAFGRRRGTRLPGTVLYCTLEPCFMCAGAILHARVDRVVYGASDPKFGACESLAEVLALPGANHRCERTTGVLADASAQMLRAFFRARR